MDQQRVKYVFNFYKKGLLVFISHLDLMRLFERAFQRSGLPLVYTEGYNPHIKFSLPFPLPLGYVGKNEYGEMYLQQKMSLDAVKNKINAYLPEDIRITAVIDANTIKGALNNYINDFVYKIVFKNGYKSENGSYTIPSDLTVERQNKKGQVSRQNVTDFIKQYVYSNGVMSLSLKVIEGRAIKLAALLHALAVNIEDIEDIIRENINLNITSVNKKKP